MGVGYRPPSNSTGPRRAAILPLDHCALSLQPFRSPVCDSAGTVFDRERITEHLLESGSRHPVTGATLKLSELTPLIFERSREGALIDPVTLKPLTEHTHVVAIRTSGRVYAIDTLKRLCLGPRAYRDPASGEGFDPRKDLITLNDPTQEGGGRCKRPAQAATTPATATGIGAPGGSATDGAGPASKRPAPAAPAPAASTGVRAFTTTGAAAASLTSTSMVPVTVNRAREMTEAELRAAVYARLRRAAAASGPAPAPAAGGTGAAAGGKGALGKGKGYVRMETSHGHLTIELHADLAPQTAHNFLELGRRGYYTNTRFHRLVKGFVLQGGDPTGKGTGGAPAWGEVLPDEIHPKLRHETRGVLSMANAGPGTGKSQFFITLAATSALDGRHSVFGRVIDGLETLARVEAIPTEAGGAPAAAVAAARASGVVTGKESPVELVLITGFTVLVNPFKDAEDEIRREQNPAASAGVGARAAAAGAGAAGANPLNPFKSPSVDTSVQSVGKYLQRPAPSQAAQPGAARPLVAGTNRTAVTAAGDAQLRIPARPAGPLAVRGSTSFAALKAAAAAAAAKEKEGT